MTMPMRPAMMGYGYGSGSMGDEQGYFGSSDPGKELASTMLAARASKRQDEEEGSLIDERKSIAAWRKAQADREAGLDPIERAKRLAELVRMGVHVPGQTVTDQGGMTPVGGGSFQDGMPPATPGRRFGVGPGGGALGLDRDPGFTRPPPSRFPGDPGFIQSPGKMGGRDIDPGFTAPPGAAGWDSGGAHTLPGAFNPATQQHNPAAGPPPGDGTIDLGGGYSMNPGQRSREDTEGLQGFGFSPAEALYFQHHPEERPSSFLDSRRGGGQSFEDWQQRWDYEGAHPHRTAEQDKPEMTLAGALQEVDRIYGKGQPGGAATTLGTDKRMRLAQQMTRRGFDPSHMPLSGTADRNARFLGRTGRSLPAQAPEEEAGDRASLERNRQIKAVTGMIPPGAEPTRVREILRQHGITDEEAEGILNPPKPRAAAGGGTHF